MAIILLNYIILHSGCQVKGRGISHLEFCETVSANCLFVFRKIVVSFHCKYQSGYIALGNALRRALPLQVANPQNSFFVLGNPNRRRRLSACVRTPFALLRNTKVGENPLAPVPKRKKPKPNYVRFRFLLAQEEGFEPPWLLA